MHKGSDVIGKSIIAQKAGNNIGSVQDLIFDHESNQILALLTDKGGWFSEAEVLPMSRVITIGPDAVMTTDEMAIIGASALPDVQRILEQDNVVKNTQVMTTDGRDLGKITDLFFTKSGAIQGYEISGGIFADAYTGRSFMPAAHALKIGDDVALVPPSTAALMEEQVGGIKAAMETTGKQIQEKSESLSGTIQEQSASLSETLQEQGQQAQDKLAQVAASSTVEEAKGRRIHKTVYSDQRQIIGVQGQIVTDQVIKNAKAENAEAALLDAVNMSQTEAAKAGANSATTQAGNQLKAGANIVAEKATQAWQSVTETAQDVKEQGANKLEAERIKRALGRPTTRVVLDKQDNVILNTGELITHESVEKARGADVLDILLNSVYTAEPELTAEDMRAPEKGNAALESDA